MRLREIKKIIEDNLPLIAFNAEKTGGSVVVTNYLKAINAINNLADFMFVSDEINSLKGMPWVYYNKSREERVIIDDQTFRGFNIVVDSIKGKCNTVIELINEAIPEENVNSISVKLPDYKELNQLSRFFSELDKSLGQAIINDTIEGKVELQNFDSGSLWIEIVVGSGIALSFIAGLTWSAMVIRKKFLEGDILIKKIEAMGIKNESLKEIQTTIEKELELLIEAETVELLGKYEFPESNPEYTERLKYSVKTLGKLLYEGAEIHHSLTAPEEAKNLFPDYNKVLLLDQASKYLVEPKE
jgi:hypothetical protein